MTWGRAFGQARDRPDGQALGQANGEHPERLWRLGGNARRLSLPVERRGYLEGNSGHALGVFSEGRWYTISKC